MVLTNSCIVKYFERAAPAPSRLTAFWGVLDRILIVGLPVRRGDLREAKWMIHNILTFLRRLIAVFLHEGEELNLPGDLDWPSLLTSICARTSTVCLFRIGNYFTMGVDRRLPSCQQTKAVQLRTRSSASLQSKMTRVTFVPAGLETER